MQKPLYISKVDLPFEIKTEFFENSSISQSTIFHQPLNTSECLLNHGIQGEVYGVVCLPLNQSYTVDKFLYRNLPIAIGGNL